MRTEKELWEVVLSRPDLFKRGLCGWIFKLWFIKLITSNEEERLISALRRSYRYSKDTWNQGYWIGPEGKIQPRIDWINKRIKQLDEANSQ